MATQPDPDIISPQSPPEAPVQPTPIEAPENQPDEIEPAVPDYDQPDRGVPETPPPPD